MAHSGSPHEQDAHPEHDKPGSDEQLEILSREWQTSVKVMQQVL